MTSSDPELSAWTEVLSKPETTLTLSSERAARSLRLRMYRWRVARLRLDPNHPSKHYVLSQEGPFIKAHSRSEFYHFSSHAT